MVHGEQRDRQRALRINPKGSGMNEGMKPTKQQIDAARERCRIAIRYQGPLDQHDQTTARAIQVLLDATEPCEPVGEKEGDGQAGSTEASEETIARAAREHCREDNGYTAAIKKPSFRAGWRAAEAHHACARSKR